MATAVEQRSQASLGAMGYDNVRYSSSPQFTNPWATANPAAAQSYPYAQQYHANAGLDHQQQQQQARQMYAQPAQPQQQALPTVADQFAQARAYPAEYVTGAPAQASSYATSAYRYSPEQYSAARSYNNFDNQPRRPSFVPSVSGRESFHEALDASRGMVAMSQDYTPRNIYGPRNGSQDSYGFPATASPHSSISSASSYPYCGSYNGSVDGSVAGSSITDYSSTSEDAAISRTLPAPGQMINGFPPPEPSTMMTQFNSKLPPSAQKKHKCKICDKRFTRPSSLQTHMYSHTGEKPFACDYEGCGRHFSVVSNLRRHKKCHRTGSNHASPEEEE